LLVVVVAGEAAAAGPFDHGRWDKLLKANVSPEGWVDYQALRGRDARELRAYLGELAEAAPAQLDGTDDRKAFWINAYNATCVQALIDAGLPAEVPHAVVIGTNIFTQRSHRIAGSVRSLDDIEHGICRASFKDPRIHAALVCGASSCPRLRPEAYQGSQLNRQLDDQARGWVSWQTTLTGHRKNTLERERNVFRVSKIFQWYEADFGGSPEGVLAFLARYGNPSDREFLATHPVRLEFLDYDWSLNTQPPRKRP
jgi:hypothetical protein